MVERNEIKIFQVDSFTDKPFKGNPAAVCILEKALDEQLMQDIATEMNLSETAFAVKKTAGALADAVKFDLRWFTPTCEVPLCGHATLATAKILHEIYELKTDLIPFSTLSGDLFAKRHGEYHQLDFPASAIEQVELPDYMIKAMNISERGLDVLLQEAFRCKYTNKLLVRFKEARGVYDIMPNFIDLLHAEQSFGTNGLIITAGGESPYDFISRFFAPNMGINEDPVTGAAHTMLAPYWSWVLNKKKLHAYQASQRGGSLIVEMREGEKGQRGRVLISGQSVIVMEAVMMI